MASALQRPLPMRRVGGGDSGETGAKPLLLAKASHKDSLGTWQDHQESNIQALGAEVLL
jgi:hypothetical protein